MKHQLTATIVMTAATLLTHGAAHAVTNTILQPVFVTSILGHNYYTNF